MCTSTDQKNYILHVSKNAGQSSYPIKRGKMSDDNAKPFITLILGFIIIFAIAIIFNGKPNSGSRSQLQLSDIEDPAYTGQVAAAASGKTCTAQWLGSYEEGDSTRVSSLPGNCIYYRDANNDPYHGGSAEIDQNGQKTSFVDACDPQNANDLLEIWCDEGNNVMMTRYHCSLGCDGAGTPNQYCKRGRRLINCES